MKHCSLKTVISGIAAMSMLVCVLAFSGAAFAQTNVSTEAELRAALSGGEDIVMTSDIKLDSCLKIESGSVTLDLNGYNLYRELSTAASDGSVIEISKNGSLTLLDSSADTGTVSGGWANNGGGIANYGTLNIQGGRITGNQATGNGGGINAAAGSKTTIENATVMKNDAKNGGGINIEVGAEPVNMINTTVKSNTSLYDGGGIQDLGGVVLDGCLITANNAYGTGGGIYVNYNTVSVKGANIIKKNMGSNVYLRNGRLIDVVGTLDAKSEIGISGDNANTTVTNGYSAYHSEEPSNYFFSDLEGGTVAFNSDKKEVTTSSGYSVVEVYDENGTVTKSETYLDPSEAWDKAVSYAGSTGNVICKLGANWSHDKHLSVSGEKKLTLDLNGFYVLRTRDNETTENGNIVTVEDGATFTITDSRPKSKGYDGLRGGVIAGGCNDTDGGGIIVGEDASLYITGGTLYDCYADGDGGGIYIDSDAKKVDIRSFTIKNCTADSVKADGGGIYICQNDFTMVDSSIEGCYSNDNGGGACIDSSGSGSGNILFKNVGFYNNIAEDYAGAMAIWSFDDDGDYIEFDTCNFMSNSSNTTEGGAVYIDSTDDEPTLFKHCNFMYNYAGEGGGAIAVYEDNVILADCVITKNEAEEGGGGIFLDNSYDLNIKGLMIIKDNTSNDGEYHHNVYFDRAFAGGASNEIYSGGLYEGSYIGLNFALNQEYEFVKGIAQYQKKFFHCDNPKYRIEFEDGERLDTYILTTEGSRTAASVFGTGSVVVIASITVVALAAGLAVIAVKKKKGDAENGNDEDE